MSGGFGGASDFGFQGLVEERKAELVQCFGFRGSGFGVWLRRGELTWCRTWGMKHRSCGFGSWFQTRGVQDTSLIINSLSPWDHHCALDIVLPQGPRGALFLMSEVFLYNFSGYASSTAPPPLPIHYESCGFSPTQLSTTVSR